MSRLRSEEPTANHSIEQLCKKRTKGLDDILEQFHLEPFFICYFATAQTPNCLIDVVGCKIMMGGRGDNNGGLPQDVKGSRCGRLEV